MVIASSHKFDELLVTYCLGIYLLSYILTFPITGVEFEYEFADVPNV